jgi:hypothetical protein
MIPQARVTIDVSAVGFVGNQNGSGTTKGATIDKGYVVVIVIVVVEVLVVVGRRLCEWVGWLEHEFRRVASRRVERLPFGYQQQAQSHQGKGWIGPQVDIVGRMPIVVEVSSWNLPLLLLVIVVVVVAAILIWLFYKGAAGQTLKERK